MNAGTQGIKIIVMSLVFILHSVSIIGQAHYLDKYPGIPIIAHTNRAASEISSENLERMKDLGVMGFYARDLSAASYNTITNSGLKVFPYQIWNGANYIVYYTDAIYTKWEAEGKGDGSNGDMELKHQNSIGVIFNEGDTSGIKTFNSTPGKLIYGPWYYQYKYYKQLALDTTNLPIEYTANFHLKINERNPGSPLPPNYSESIVCTIMVAVTHPVRVNKDSTLFSIELKVKDFLPPDGTGWNSWKDFTIDYNLSTVKDKSEEILKEGFVNDDIDTSYTTNWMQYKIEWAGSTFLDLYVDYVEISDVKGRELKTTQIKTLIKNLVSTQFTDTSKVLGWFGLNEPASIDNYEPFRIVDSLINANSNNLHLYTTFTTGWGGVYGMPWPGAFESNGGVYIGSEFIKRSKLPYLSLNSYNYNYPITPEIRPTYYLENIEYVTKENLHKLDSLGIPISHSTQSGRFYNFNSSCVNEFKGSINPTSEQMLYHINLGLLYGMIELTCDPLFTLYNRDAERPCPDSLYLEGLINYKDNTLTYLGVTWCDKVAPRMSGLLGKTSRLLDPSSQHLLINPSVSSDLNINSIKKIKLDYENVTEAMPSYLDLGFFSKEGFEPNRYFMIINRYYSDSLLNKFKIDFRNLSGIYNWSFMNYIDSSNTTIIANETGFVTSPQFQINSGDAILFSLFPVAEFGGKLFVSENVGNGMTLTGDMTIENGATLFIYDNYYAKANITVKAGGKIISAENAKIIFDPGKKLIVEGSAEIKGTSTNRLTLEFNSSTNQGVVIKAGASIDLQYCDIKYSQVGIAAEVGTEGINISYSSFTNCTSTGILMLGDTQHNEATPIVSNCTFTNCSTGISAANYSEILINQNTVNNAYLGITISSIPSAFIQGNVINGNSNGNNDGILVFNSGGYIRSNIVQNHVNGIRIGNSSPDIGGNILEENKSHGLYVGSGSIPNLVGHLQINPPLYFPLSGYNKILNNGSGTLANILGNDGQSEIFLSASNIALRDGCNEIRDDRTGTPSMNTLLLMNGSLAPGGGRQLDARNNYWGTTTPTAARFGSLSVIFSPYYGEPCLLPEGGGGGGEEMLVLKTSSGEIVDSIFAAEGVPENFTTLEASYSIVDNYFATGNVDLAKPLYEQIVSSNYTAEEKLPAYNKLYTIGNLISEDENYFNSLQTTFNDIANAETDTLLKKIYNQNAIKCDVSKEEYLIAINKFDNIIQENPNSEEAIYAEIDIITTALNLDTTNSQLGKMGNGKYLVKGTSDYLSKLNDILQSKFGINSEEKEHIIPKEYSLYQNYPNPFNPTTTIKFDLPNDGIITLEIFDILGRRITTLVAEYRTAGSYEQVFNASSLASGVYVYKLQAGDFVSSRKMILLK